MDVTYYFALPFAPGDDGIASGRDAATLAAVSCPPMGSKAVASPTLDLVREDGLEPPKD